MSRNVTDSPKTYPTRQAQYRTAFPPACTLNNRMPPRSTIAYQIQIVFWFAGAKLSLSRAAFAQLLFG